MPRITTSRADSAASSVARSRAGRALRVLVREGPIAFVERSRGAVARRWRRRRTASPTWSAADAPLAAAEATLHAFSLPPAGPAVGLTNPSIGIVIPAGTDVASLAAALQSVVGQTYRNWRCVVVDDASPEDVGSVVKPFRLADSRVEHLRHAANGGFPAARNTGLRHLDTDIVVFLDAGDLLVPRALQHIADTFVTHWHDPSVAGVHGQVTQAPAATRPAGLAEWSGEPPRSPVDWTGYKGECPFSAHSVALRKGLLDACGGFDESLRDGDDDWDLWYRLLRHGYRFVPNPHHVGAYRQRRSSMIRDHQGIHLAGADRLFDANEQWARLDPAIVVGRGGGAPLSRARDALARAKRAATVIGMDVVAAGSLEPLTSSRGYDLLDPRGLAEGRRDEIVGAARGGVVRGLGIASVVAEKLSPAGGQAVDRLAALIADEILRRDGPPADSEPQFDATARWEPIDVLVVAESAADVVALLPVVEAVNGRVGALDLELMCGDSGANSRWREAGIPIVSYHQVVTTLAEVRRLVGCAPVGPVVADLFRAAQLAGSTSQLIQPEGRPRMLGINAGSALDDLVVPVAAVIGEAATPSVVPLDDRRRALTGWRGSRFPQRLPFEDGPIDVDSTAKLEALRGAHTGETAVIIGNGPSLNETELEIVAGVATFGVNGIFLAEHRLAQPITYYVVEDTSVFKENVESIKAFEAQWKLFPAMYRASFDDDEIDDHTVFFRMNAGFYERKTGTTGHPRFSCDATQRLYCGQSVTIINLQLAHWMGFARVVLVGMDFSYTIPEDVDRDGALIISRSDDPNHFDPQYFGAGKSWKDPLLDRVLVNYHLVDEMYRATGREIINSTEGGKLDLFPRLPLRQALGVEC